MFQEFIEHQVECGEDVTPELIARTAEINAQANEAEKQQRPKRPGKITFPGKDRRNIITKLTCRLLGHDWCATDKTGEPRPGATCRRTGCPAKYE